MTYVDVDVKDLAYFTTFCNLFADLQSNFCANLAINLGNSDPLSNADLFFNGKLKSC